MKSIIRNSVLALSLLSLPAAPHAASAQAGGPSAGGRLRLSSEDGSTKRLEFEAAANEDGRATGRMIFSGPEEIPEQDVDGAGAREFGGRLEDLHIEAEFDGMVVEGNRASMSGVVTACSLSEYIGRRVLLVVEDNGDGGAEKTPDKVMWGLYKPSERGWTPTDAELKDDDGALLTWVAKDFERDDDRGVPMPKKGGDVSAQSFPLSSHDFAEFRYTDGDLQVRQ
jgi:hypothetical protein